MTTSHQDQNKSSGKPHQRGRKTDRRSQKSEQQQSPKLDQQGEDQIGLMVASAAAPAESAATPADVPLIGEVLLPDVPSTRAAAPADYRPVSIQTIANAHGDYAMKSIEESRSFVEKLVGVRSFDRAIEVQTEFARQAYASFVAQSQKIGELYGELARQTFSPWERFVARVTQAGRQIS
jgi:hypothetical protein